MWQLCRTMSVCKEFLLRSNLSVWHLQTTLTNRTKNLASLLEVLPLVEAQSSPASAEREHLREKLAVIGR